MDDRYSISEVTGITGATALADTGLETVTLLHNLEATGVTEQLKVPESPQLIRPYFSVYERLTKVKDREFKAGVWYHGSKPPKDGEATPLDVWVCSPLHVIAITSFEGGSFGRLLRFQNTLGEWREWAMPMRLLKGRGEELRGELLDQGVEISPDARQYLDRYLQGEHPDRQVTAATSTGWHNDALFIMPRINIGTGDAIYQSEHANSDDYQTSGVFESWRLSIGAMLPGNPLLQLAIGSALAGPLLHLVQKSGGGFHIIGDSSTGKTTLIEAACSVWGHGEQFKRTWRATSNGLEGVAAQRNDTLLALDEIGEADPKDIGSVVYCIANGTGKARASRSGDARQAKRWKLILLSTGEKRLSDIMAEGGKRQQTGQEIRLITLDAQREFGCWDCLHDHIDGQKASNLIKKISQTHYGHLGPAFIKALIDSKQSDQLPAKLHELTKAFPEGTGQEQRAAERFAIVALALELAQSFDLLDIEVDEAKRSMVELFNQWREQRSSGSGEDHAILQSLSDFVSRHGDTMFSDVNNPTSQFVRDRAGWWKIHDDHQIWLFTAEGLKRAVPGYQNKRIIRAVEKAGWLVTHDIKKSSKNTRVDGQNRRLYYIDVAES